MPQWLKDSFQERTQEGDALYDVAKGLDPTDVLGMNDREYDAYDTLLGQANKGQGMLDDAWNTAGANSGQDAVDYYERLAGGLGDGYDHTYTGDRMTDLIGGKDFELDYTDNVVDTTLAGMQRQADRDRLLRQSQQASTGGTSNTRSAVEDAIAGQLTGMNMAEMEAGLRDDAQRFGTESLFQQADMLDSSDRFLSEMDQEKDQFNLGFGKDIIDAAQRAKEFGMDFDLSKAAQQAGMSDTQLKQSMAMYDIMKGFGGEERMLEQAGMNAEKDHLGWLANILQGSNQTAQNPVGTTQTQTTPGNSAFQNILGAGTSTAGLFMTSDERVKEEISEATESALDKLENLSAKEYKYKDGFGHTRTRTTGLMAQDLEKAGIEGAVTEIDGVKHVDPYPVLATVVQAVNELREAS